MGDRKPGPICSSELGSNWIDDGTRCRSRTSSKGPLGILMSLAMGAVPKDPSQAAQDEEDKALIGYDIQVIGSSQFGKTREGQDIVVILTRLHRNGNIAYGDTSADDGRGSWDGQIITVSQDFRQNLCSTSATLVHEASHALWRKKHPKPDGKDKSKLFNDAVEDELHAQENELTIYTWLKNNKGCSADFLLDTRLERKKKGILRSVIEESFSAIATPDG
jgi:hypothetical protein